MESLYQDNDDTINIFKEECEQILEDFVTQLDNYEKEQDANIITKLMRDAHSVKGSAGIAGFHDVQKAAHRIEDILASIKIFVGSKTNQKNNPFLQKSLVEIRELISKIKEELKNQTDKYNIFSEAFYNNVLKQISILKTDVSVAPKLAQASKALSSEIKLMELSDISNSLYNIFSKIQQPQDISSNVINTLSGAFKIIKKIVAEGNEEVKEDLFFTKQRLSVVEQMLSVKPVKKIPVKAEDNNSKTKDNLIPDIFNFLRQDSIKTLRIETTKLDKLYENVIKLESMSKKEKKRQFDFFNNYEKILSKIFEFEKYSARLKNITEKTEKNAENEKILEECSLIASCLDENIKNIQETIPEYSFLQNKNKKTENDFYECLQQVQTTVKNIRILPIGVILHMFPRMVRDIATAVNKDIVMEIKGSETGVDKKILEEIKMPLIHILRNAVDHGIESPEEREKQGKPKSGKIEISAYNQNEKFIIKVKDDGCGIDFDKIKSKALKEKLLENSEIKKYKKHDFLNIIFKPGFSTKDNVTELSGRGMGLDIVYTKVSSLNGHIKINTEKNKGTEIILTIPSGYFNDKVVDTKEEKNKYNILLVDDSKTTLIHFSRILQKAGFNVYTKDNAKDGLKELKSKKYDLLISDVEMAGMNGAEFVLNLRKEKKFSKFPVLILSMLEQKRLEQLFKNLNINGIINKANFEEETFINTIKEILNE